MLEHIKTVTTMNMDETTVRVLKYKKQTENENRQKSYIWLGIGGPKNKKAVIYRYFESRSPQFIRPFINGFKGYLQTDEYSGYEAALKKHKILYPKDKIVHIACAAHIRRKFYNALPNGKSRNSAIGFKYIQRIYFEENRLREKQLPDSEFIQKRKETIKPIGGIVFKYIFILVDRR